ncbi:radical SAM/SPASM domain-containing protein [Streptomyces silvensis]|uniref:radical SAM/SPASM domain-containing protein n=1 Tax=Streptomyces silvensis TaxID=1765722 RepID=UPI00099ED609|nr:radical SAM protein [Streptomyces silvensis]
MSAPTVEKPLTETLKPPRMLWLDLTRKCQLACVHCYNESGPDGDHGTMEREDWFRLIGEAAELGVPHVQLIGGEPMMHPNGIDIADFALSKGMGVEVYSNLVHVTEAWWGQLRHARMSLATSYYSALAAEHNAITGRRSHARTRQNIAKALAQGTPLRVGIVSLDDAKDTEATRQDLESLGVTNIGVDHVRLFGRGAPSSQDPNPAGLCGHCGVGVASVSPTGEVSPCVFSTWLPAGNVRAGSLSSILSGPAMDEATALIRSARGNEASACTPDCVPKNPCDPRCEPNSSCRPGTPPSECQPRN